VPIVYALDYREIGPIIRIAHRLAGPIQIPHRQIFDHELVLITRGSTEFVDENATLLCRAGDMLLIRPFLWHGFRRVGASPCEHIAVHFDFAPAIPARSSGESNPAPYEVRLSHGLRLPNLAQRPAGRPSAIETEMAALVTAWENPRPPAALQARSHLLTILLALLRKNDAVENASMKQGESRSRQRVQRATRYIDEHLGQPIAADDLAAAARLSPSQTARLFRQQTGHTPMQFLRRARIDRARRLLADVDLSIKEIAAQCGFDDPYHFSRVFREVDGLPPTLYRQALLAGRPNPNSGTNST
jgi:AraC-like DNA-binding protein